MTVRRTRARAALLLATALVLPATGCGRSGSGSTEPAPRRGVTPSELAEKEQAVQEADPFADLPAYQKPTRVITPTTKVGQLALLDDATWKDAVHKAHDALAIFAEAGRAWDRGEVTQEERDEIRRGKALLDEALENTWQIEEDLSKDPARRSTHQAVLKTRAEWNQKLREVGKLVRG